MAVDTVRYIPSAAGFYLAAALGWSLAAQAPAPPFTAPPGFQVNLMAGSSLAHDIRAMAISQHGVVAVGGPGFIKLLHQPSTNGPAVDASLFAAPASTVTDLCFDGTGLLAVMDGAVYLYRDNDDDGEADGLPTKVFEVQPGKGNLRTLRQDPDGRWLILAGWQAEAMRGHTLLDSSPIRQPQGGMLLRANLDWQGIEVLAHGFREPAGLALNWRGDLFTFDDEGAAERQLPGYQPARLFHIGYGLHHGWRTSGPERLRAWPEYGLDQAPALEALGAALPSAVECYQHWRFPAHYHEGLLAADWAYGRVFFMPLSAAGGASEPFLEPVSGAGFAPTALCVAPDGALLVATGGRGLSGGVFRIHYAGDDAAIREEANFWENASPLDQVLRAPQPLAAWSFAHWEPLAQRLGRETIARAALDPQRPVEDRVRAVEVLTRLFDGLSPRDTKILIRDAAPDVRARVAWSLARRPNEHLAEALLALAMDNHPLPRRAALEALLERYLDLEDAELTPVAEASLGHLDKRVRLLAARLAARLPTSAWNTLRKNCAAAAAPKRLGFALAGTGREFQTGLRKDTLELALGAWSSTPDLDLRLDAVSMMMLALGGTQPETPSREALAAYEAAIPLADQKPALARMRQLLRTAFPSASPLLNLEVSRVLAMVQEDDPQLPRRVLAQITPRSAASADFHYLAVLARLPGPRPAELTVRTAAALTGLDRKLAGKRPGAEWNPRLVELAAALFRQDAALMETVLRQPDFPREGNLPLVELMSPAQQLQAAALFHSAASRNPAFAFPPAMIALLAKLPPDQTAALYRRQWPGSSCREDLTVQLARKPNPADYPIFIAGLDAEHFPVAETCVRALLLLPRRDAPKDLVPLMRLLFRLEYEPAQTSLRQQVMALLNRQAGQRFALPEQGQPPESLPRLYQPVHAWFAAAYPSLAAAAESAAAEPANPLSRLLATAPWKQGRAERGALALERRGCADCHAGPERLGPDLAETARRLAPPVFFQEIAAPARHVEEQYRATEFRLRNQAIVLGLVMFEREDVSLVRTAAGAAVRVLAAEVISRRKVQASVMPTGLLQGMSPAEMADLIAFLKGQ